MPAPGRLPPSARLTCIRRDAQQSRAYQPLPVARPHRLPPEPSSCTTHAAFEAPPKLHQLAVVPDELRQCFWADDSHVAAGVAAKPDVVAFDHGVPKGHRRPVTEFGWKLGECDAPFWAS